MRMSYRLIVLAALIWVIGLVLALTGHWGFAILVWSANLIWKLTWVFTVPQKDPTTPPTMSPDRTETPE
jgi:hypothetical protein